MQIAKAVIIKSKEEINKVKISSKIAGCILMRIKKALYVGMETIEIDLMARKLSKEKSVTPAFLGYHGYPAAICVSVNEEIVHGIPGKRVLRAGDVVGLDFGVYSNGYYGDTALTHIVGKPLDPDIVKLVETTENALNKAIERAKPGNRLGDISAAIQREIEGGGFSVVRDFVGHGLGKNLHEEPQIPGYGKEGTGIRLRPGMVLAIEPMANLGSYEADVLKDGWTAVTRDRLISAHFEHTLALSEDGNEVLSMCLEG